MFCSQKTVFKIATLIVVLFTLTGCLKRVHVVRRERLDQSLTGNRGVLFGNVPTTSSTAPKTREYVEWSIEIPSYKLDRAERAKAKERTVDKTVSGNRGYVEGRTNESVPPPPVRQAITPPPKQEKSFFEKPFFQREEKAAPSAPTHTDYTVQKGDTLGKISMKIYGTSRKWKEIFEANRDRLQNPDRLKVGQVLRIPSRDEEMHRTIK